MNFHELAQRLGMTVAGFARAARTSRAAVNSWDAGKEKTYSATPRPQTLLEMADALEEHAEVVVQVAGELRGAAGDPEPTRSPRRGECKASSEVYIGFHCRGGGR
jgi:transcriptional regulator with XRE-family HTH domain